MTGRTVRLLGGITMALTVAAPLVSAQVEGVPRTPSGRPDLSGTYDTATLTPLQRPREFGERLTLTAEEVAIINSDPDGLATVFGLAPAGSDERAAARREEQRAGFETQDGSRDALAGRRAMLEAITPSGLTAERRRSRSTGWSARPSSPIRQVVVSLRGPRRP